MITYRVYDQSRNGERLIGAYRSLDEALRAVRRACWCGFIVQDQLQEEAQT